jgi:diguanylate cyclase (GGDEF)-like protein
MTRALRLAGWPAFGLTQLSLLVWPAFQVQLYSVLIMVVTCAGTILHAVTAGRSRGHARRVWSITAVALGCWAFAEVSVGIPAVLTGVAPPRGLLANLLNLGAFGLAVAAMLTLPTAPRGPAARLRMVFDGLVAASALLGVAWMLVLAPMTRIQSTSSAVVDLSYPVLAAGVLAVGLVLLGGQAVRGITATTAITGSVVVLTAWLLLEIVANVWHVEWLRPYVYAGYIVAAVLMGLAALAPVPQGDERAWRPATPVGNVLPYGPVVVYLGVVLHQSLSGRAIDLPTVLAGLVMIGAVFVRQLIELRLNAALSRSLAVERSRFAHEAAHDPLTGLPNRARLTAEVAAAPITALLLIDLDGFKAVNDTLGHTAGDELLCLVADRLRRVSHGHDALPARLGGDEFAVLLRSGGLGLARTLARDVLAALAEPGLPAAVGASIGIAPLTDRARLLHEADLALYDAKNRGKGRFRVFDRELSLLAEQRRLLQAELALAVERGQFEVVYQPIADLATGESHASEALVRWRHPMRGLVLPDDFLPAAQDAGLLAGIDRWVLGAAAAQLAEWRRTDPGYAVSVNLSVAYLVSGRVVADVREVLRAHDLPGWALTCEVTETSLIADLDAAATTLRELRDLGVRVALDDFGVGWSSLTYLRRLPVDIVKIDRSFVRELTHDPQAGVLVQAVLGLVRGLGLDCVAEGVEDESQVAQLLAMGCRRGQGYLFATPQPPERLVIREDNRAPQRSIATNARPRIQNATAKPTELIETPP